MSRSRPSRRPRRSDMPRWRTRRSRSSTGSCQGWPGDHLHRSACSACRYPPTASGTGAIGAGSAKVEGPRRAFPAVLPARSQRRWQASRTRRRPLPGSGWKGSRRSAGGRNSGAALRRRRAASGSDRHPRRRWPAPSRRGCPGMPHHRARSMWTHLVRAARPPLRSRSSLLLRPPTWPRQTVEQVLPAMCPVRCRIRWLRPERSARAASRRARAGA